MDDSNDIDDIKNDYDVSAAPPSSLGDIIVIDDNQDNNNNDGVDDSGEASDGDAVEIANYYSGNMEGYTPLNNFNMNDLIMMNDSDTDSITTSDADDDDVEEISGCNDEKNEAEKGGNDNDLGEVVPINFHSLAEQALRVLDDEHLSMLEKDNHDMNITSISHSNKGVNDTIDIDNVNANMQIDHDENCKPSEPFAISTTEESVLSSLATTTTLSSSKEDDNMAAIKNPQAVDINAIQKAMQSIRLKSPTLATTLDAGATSSMTSLSNATHAATNTALNHIIDVQFTPRRQKNLQQQYCYTTHGIIPSGPLSAFRRSTRKAQMASANLSRSATLSEAVLRLWPIISFQRKMRDMIDQGLLMPQQQQQQQQQPVNKHSKIFTIHILGADGVECTSLESVRKSVGPFVRWFDAALSSGVLSESNDIDTLWIEFSGPNIPSTLVGQTLDILSRQSKKSCAPSSTSSRLIMATATFQPRQYHEIIRSANIDAPIVDIAIAFNAGIWGYDSWKPTVVSLINTSSPGNGKTLFVITSYTMEECEDDADVIADVVKDVISTKMSPHATTNSIIARQLWIEHNPFSSRVERHTESAPPGRKYFENSAWQAWLLG